MLKNICFDVQKRSAEIEFFEFLNNKDPSLKDWEDIAEEVIAYFTDAFHSRKTGDNSTKFEHLLRE